MFMSDDKKKKRARWKAQGARESGRLVAGPCEVCGADVPVLRGERRSAGHAEDDGVRSMSGG